MSNLRISEFSDLPFTSNRALVGAAAAATQNWINDQLVAIGSTSAACPNPFNAQTQYILVVAGAGCSIAWTPAGAETVAATTSNRYVPPNVPMIFGVSGGMLVSVIGNESPQCASISAARALGCSFLGA